MSSPTSASGASSSASARYHYTSSSPSPQLLSDIALLNTFSDATLSSFTTLLLSYLTHSPSQDSLLKEFTESQSDEQVKGRIRGVLTSILHFFTTSISRTGSSGNSSAANPSGINLENIREDLLSLGLSQEHTSSLTSSFLSSFSSLTESSLLKTLHTTHLYDISWRFGVSASSSEQLKIGSCFLQLQLTLERGKGKENVVMELSLPQFYQFLHQMQLANRQMQELAK